MNEYKEQLELILRAYDEHIQEAGRLNASNNEWFRLPTWHEFCNELHAARVLLHHVQPLSIHVTDSTAVKEKVS